MLLFLTSPSAPPLPPPPLPPSQSPAALFEAAQNPAPSPSGCASHPLPDTWSSQSRYDGLLPFCPPPTPSSASEAPNPIPPLHHSQHLKGAWGCDGTEGADLRSHRVRVVDVQVLPPLLRTIPVLLPFGLLTQRIHSATAHSPGGEGGKPFLTRCIPPLQCEVESLCHFDSEHVIVQDLNASFYKKQNHLDLSHKPVTMSSES